MFKYLMKNIHISEKVAFYMQKVFRDDESVTRNKVDGALRAADKGLYLKFRSKEITAD